MTLASSTHLFQLVRTGQKSTLPQSTMLYFQNWVPFLLYKTFSPLHKRRHFFPTSWEKRNKKTSPSGLWNINVKTHPTHWMRLVLSIVSSRMAIHIKVWFCTFPNYAQHLCRFASVWLFLFSWWHWTVNFCLPSQHWRQLLPKKKKKKITENKKNCNICEPALLRCDLNLEDRKVKSEKRASVRLNVFLWNQKFL